MPLIRLDDDVFHRLQSLCAVSKETPNSVIKRLLEADSVKVVPRKAASKLADSPWRGRRATVTPQAVYERHLHYVLAINFNGQASRREATDAALDLMQGKGLLPASAGEILASNGETKAETTVAWCRNVLKEAGLIKTDSPRGIWELTNAGLKAGSEPELLKSEKRITRRTK